MSDLRNMRIGDTILSTRGTEFLVEEIEEAQAVARHYDNGRSRTFEARKLELIDSVSGLWQEMQG